MSGARDERDCCTPPERGPRHNAPGLPAVAYRIGTHGSFLRDMVARLARTAIPDGPNAGSRPLGELRTRAPDDPIIALLDAWACAADVATFYQERIANEGFLRTATERRSVLELARSVGYELRPGVAARATLRFTLEETEDAPERVVVPAGSPIMSVPGPGELPQPFETEAALEARRTWNAMAPRRWAPRPLAGGTDRVFVAAGGPAVSRGQMLLAVAGTGWDCAIVEAVDTDRARGVVALSVGRGAAGGLFCGTLNVEPDTLHVLRRTARPFGARAPAWTGLSRAARADLIGEPYDPASPPDDNTLGTEWRDFALVEPASGTATLTLEGELPGVVAGSWFVVRSSSGAPAAALVDAASMGTSAGFGTSSATTSITYDVDSWPLALAGRGRRDVTAFVESEPLTPVDAPYDDALDADGALELTVAAADLADLERGRQLVAWGRDPSGHDVAELARLDSVEATVEGLAKVRFERPLDQTYDLDTLRISANVVLASHGETIAGEVLGSGDARKAFQRFTLRKSPLTHVAADTPSGSASSLEVRVDGVRYEPRGSLRGAGPEGEVYVARIADDGTVEVRFGDGRDGARLPTGVENVVARYRKGIGAPGMVKAGALTLLKQRPLGVKGVVNPLPAEGAADPERLADARDNAPSTVLTLDRAVSLQDFEDFARAYAGVTKARADELWDGEKRVVTLTVAGADRGPLDPEGDLASKLLASLRRAMDPTQVVRLARFEPRAFRVSLGLRHDPRRRFEDVAAAVQAALQLAFGFDRRGFGQRVAAAEVVEAVHAVPGVVALDLDALYRTDEGLPPAEPEESQLETGYLAQVLAADRPHVDGDGAFVPAELLLLDESAGGVAVTVMNL